MKDTYGDVGIVHRIRRYARSFTTNEDFDAGSKSANSPQADGVNETGDSDIPEGYGTGDTCTPFYLDSGKSVVFSVPREHVAKNLYIEIEFWYEWENRRNELGDFPQSYVSYGHLQLPDGEK